MFQGAEVGGDHGDDGRKTSVTGRDCGSTMQQDLRKTGTVGEGSYVYQLHCSASSVLLSEDTVHYKSDETVNFCCFRCATTSPTVALPEIIDRGCVNL